MSNHVVSNHAVSNHAVSNHAVSNRVVSNHVVSSHVGANQRCPVMGSGVACVRPAEIAQAHAREALRRFNPGAMAEERSLHSMASG
jgi:hypothetical protein